MFRFFRIAATAVPLLLISQAACAQSLDNSLNKKIDAALAFSEIQIENLAQRRGEKRYPCYTDVEGDWIGRDLNGWCCGFSAGLMWMMYDLSLIHI